jgi:hypothetical protein
MQGITPIVDHRLNLVEAAYHAATGQWTGADVCRDAQRAAAEAEILAKGALKAARAGKWDLAVDLAARAARRESLFGNATVWAAFQHAIEEAARGGDHDPKAL